MTDDAPPAFDPEVYDDAQSYVVEYGRDAVDLLDPRPGERVLDLGSGTGHLTADVAEALGSQGTVTGIDASPAMVEKARQTYTDLDFQVVDATAFTAQEPFDAVFSNAALHWIADQDAVLGRVADALGSGGRFVAEMGAVGNVAGILDAVRAEGSARGVDVSSPWYFPTLGEYAGRLEAHGFEVHLARTFERATYLEGEAGLCDWLAQFGDDLLAPFDRDERDEVVAAVEDRLREARYDADAEQWLADYRRLQFVAVLDG